MLLRPTAIRSHIPSALLLFSSRQPFLSFTVAAASAMTSQPDAKKIPALVAKQYEAAVSSKDAFFYPSDVFVLPESSTGVKVPWLLRNVPALLEKPTPNAVRHEQAT